MLREIMISFLLEGDACSSIKYRVQKEILKESQDTLNMRVLHSGILDDIRVKKIIENQKQDGWLGESFHGEDSMEASIRFLLERGLGSDDAVISRAFEALERDSSDFPREFKKVGSVLDSRGFGGSESIRAALFAQAGLEEKDFVRYEVEKALEAFDFVRSAGSLSKITESFNGRLVFKEDAIWPSIYHLRLLAFARGWRSEEGRKTVAGAVKRLAELSPIKHALLRHKSQLIAPASVFMDDFNSDMDKLDSKGWMMWFHRMELLARMGIADEVPEIKRQIDRLRSALRKSGAKFAEKLSHPYFTHWNSYTGLALEENWKSPSRRINDLTFRSLLILNNADM